MSAVKLRDFFEMQSSTGMDAHRKAQIFSTIRQQTSQVSQTHGFSIMRNSWYFKTATTAALAFVLTYLLYTPITTPLFQSSDSSIIARNTSNIAQAGYVGDMVATQGQITIVRNGVTTTTSQLQGGDVIYLYNTSKADFVLRDGSRGSVEGPAQLTIVEHQDSGLVLTVDHARYMQIDKTDSSSPQTKEDLVIETNTSRITTKKDDTVHLALVTSQDRQFIQNKGDDVTIESIVPTTASPVTQQLASSHVADVTDAVKVYTQVAVVYNELKTQSISKTYDLSDEDSLAIDDVKRLLTFDSTRNTKPTQNRAIVFNNNIRPNTPNIANEAIAKKSSTNDIDNIPVYEDQSEDQSEDTPVALFAMRSMSESSTAAEDSASGSATLASKDAAIVVGVLGQALEDSPQETTITTTSATTTSVIKPLTSSQLSIIKNLSSHSCVTSKQFQQLQTGFEIDHSQTVDQTIATITSTFYLSKTIKSTINSLTICDDDQN